MTLAGLAELHRRFLVLLSATTRAFVRYTWMRHDPSQLLLVVRRVKGPIEGGTLNLARHPLLQLGHHRYHHVLIQDAPGHHLVVADKASGILDHQYLVTVLNGVRLLAPLDQLRVRLENAEELFFVGHRFTQQDTPPGCAAHFVRQLQVMLQFLLPSVHPVTQPIADAGLDAEGHSPKQLTRPLQEVLGQIQSAPVPRLETVRPFAFGTRRPIDIPHDLLDVLEQMPVLTPAGLAMQRRQRRCQRHHLAQAIADQA